MDFDFGGWEGVGRWGMCDDGAWYSVRIFLGDDDLIDASMSYVHRYLAESIHCDSIH